VKNHDFTQKNLIFSNFRGGRAPGAPPSGSAPVPYVYVINFTSDPEVTSSLVSAKLHFVGTVHFLKGKGTSIFDNCKTRFCLY
jgi:hypothetical protein